MLTFVDTIIAMAVGMLLATAAVPIPWKFPGYDRQVLVTKIATAAVIAGAIAHVWIRLGIEISFR